MAVKKTPTIDEAKEAMMNEVAEVAAMVEEQNAKEEVKVKEKDSRIKINIDNKDYIIDVTKNLPFELFKTNFKWQAYIPSDVVRAIMKETLMFPYMKVVECTKLNDQLIQVTAKVWVREVQGTATEVYKLDAFAKAAVGNSARVVMLAIKDALRYYFKCFEWEYSLADDDKDLTPTSVFNEPKWDAELFEMYKWKILNAANAGDLTLVAGKIKDNSNVLSSTQTDTLRDMFGKRMTALTSS